MIRSRFLILLLILAAASAAAAPGVATPWRVEAGLVSPGTEAHLKERYPEVHGPADLENLLRDVARRHRLLHLEAVLVNGTWVLRGKPATVVSEINVELMTRDLRQPVSALALNYFGQVDSPETRAKVQSSIQKYMARRGYPGSKVTLAATPGEDGMTYDVNVTEGDPCIIDRVEVAFKLPAGLRLGIQPGDLCDMEEAQTAVSNLETELRGRGYNQVKMELADQVFHPAQGSATVYVSGVLGQRVRYEITDTSHRFLIDDLFGDEDLNKIDPTIVGPDAMAAELVRRYNNRGFLDVKVKGPEVRKTSDDEFVYVYTIDPGTQYILKSMQFEGATVFKQEELLDTMGLASLWQTAHPYNLEEVQQGLTAIRAQYQQAGYWDTKVRDPAVQKDKEGGSVRVTIQVEEGLPRHLKAVNIKGNDAIPTGELTALLGTPPGAPLDRAKLVDFQRALREIYINRGYQYAEVQIDLRQTEAKKIILVDVDVTVNESSRVRIGDVTIVGLVRTHEKVVRRELLFHPGEWYDPAKIFDSRQALTRLGLFRSVQIGPADPNALANKESEVDLIVDVREGKAGNVAFGPGWSYIKGWNYSAEATYNNLGGAGRTATVRGAISEERDQYSIGPHTLLGRKIGAGYLEPYLLDLPIDGSVKASQEAQFYNNLWQLTYAGELELIYRIRAFPGSKVSTFYGQKIAKSEGSIPQLEDQVATDERVGQAGFRANLDRRDNIKFPTSGYTLDAETAWARYGLDGDTRYFHWDLGASFYKDFFEKVVLAINIDLSAYEDIQRKGSQPGILASPERLASGGADTVRGYPTDTLGPIVLTPGLDSSGHCVQIKTPLNGNMRTTIKTELRHKISDSTAVTVFTDNGNAWLSPSQLQKFQAAYVGVKANEQPIADTSQVPPADCNAPPTSWTVQDNFNYNYAELLRNPGFLWSRHYWGYGLSLNLLTALGSVNFAYALPWREPESDDCKANASDCYIRARQTNPWIKRGQVIINVGARF